jgi:hypothetical protein
MPNIVVLNAAEHASLAVDRRPAAALGDGRRFVQVVVREFPLLATQYPILLTKDSETGAFFCGAMLGFDDGENLFLQGPSGYDGYRPLNLQRDPFYFSDPQTLAIDLDSPRVGQSEGERLFNGNGEPSAYYRSVLHVFEELRPGLAATKVFLDVLLQLKLLKPMEVHLSFDDGVELELQDLYTISPEALKELGDADVLQLYRRGYLYLIHLMMMSVQQIARLARRRNDRLLAPMPDAWPA